MDWNAPGVRRVRLRSKIPPPPAIEDLYSDDDSDVESVVQFYESSCRGLAQLQDDDSGDGSDDDSSLERDPERVGPRTSEHAQSPPPAQVRDRPSDARAHHYGLPPIVFRRMLRARVPYAC